MKRVIMLLSLLATIACAGTALAIPHSIVNNANFSFGTGSTYTATFDLTKLGFQPGVEFVTSAALLLDFANEGVVKSVRLDGTEKVPAGLGYLIYQGQPDLSYDVTSTFQDGILDVSVTAAYDTVKLNAATLSAEVVPEPGTILLLGAGFFGLAIYAKRRQNA